MGMIGLINEHFMMKMYTDKLTDEELAVLGNVAFLYQDPRDRLFDFKKVSGLFTKVLNGIPVMEEATLDALSAVIDTRL